MYGSRGLGVKWVVDYCQGLRRYYKGDEEVKGGTWVGEKGLGVVCGGEVGNLEEFEFRLILGNRGECLFDSQ